MYQENDHPNALGSTGESSSRQSGSREPSSGASAGTSSGTSPQKASHDSQLNCANCGNSFWRSETTCMPFCSRRCQQIDLGMWLNESRGLPYEGEGTPDRLHESDDESFR